MAGVFRKTSTKRPTQARRKPGSAAKRPSKGHESKTPVTPVAVDQTYQDVIATKVLHVLVDLPKAPQDMVVLVRAPQRLSMFTTDAQPLQGTLLVYALKFERVADGGMFTLKLERRTPLSVLPIVNEERVVELFTNVASNYVFSKNLDLPFGPHSEDLDLPFAPRFPDYDEIHGYPPFDDKDLDSLEAPFASLTESGS